MTFRHATTFSFLVLAFVLALPNGAQAKLTSCTGNVSPDTIQKENWIRLQLPIPNVTVTCTDDADTPEQSDDVQRGYVKDMGQYIGGLYKYFVGAIGIMASLMVFYGGLRWLSAGGNASRVKEAKDTIFSALIAILIAFGSYLLLFTINPKLVVMNPPVLKVADTFLVSFDNTCQTQTICLSGTNVGNRCTSDAACPGTSGGGCGLPIELEGSAQPECGTRYKYKTNTGLKLTSESCVGTYCADGQVCTNTDNARSTPTEGKGECMTLQDRCRDINTAGEGVPTNSDCAVADVPGVGVCRKPDNFCVFLPLLTCPVGYDRAPCNACVTAGKTCPKYNNSETTCSQDAVLYSGELNKTTNKYPAICCTKPGPPVEFECRI